MEITASGTITKKTMRALHRSGRRKKQAAIYILLFCILLGVGILEGVLWGFTNLVFIMIACCLIGIAFQLYLYLVVPAIRMNARKKLIGVTNHFEFHENDFSVSAAEAEFTENSTIKYSFIKKVVETKEYLFLYLQTNGVYVLEKQTICGNTDDALQKRLMDSVPKYTKM